MVLETLVVVACCSMRTTKALSPVLRFRPPVVSPISPEVRVNLFEFLSTAEYAKERYSPVSAGERTRRVALVGTSEGRGEAVRVFWDTSIRVEMELLTVVLIALLILNSVVRILPPEVRNTATRSPDTRPVTWRVCWLGGLRTVPLESMSWKARTSAVAMSSTNTPRAPKKVPPAKVPKGEAFTRAKAVS